MTLVFDILQNWIDSFAFGVVVLDRTEGGAFFSSLFPCDRNLYRVPQTQITDNSPPSGLFSEFKPKNLVTDELKEREQEFSNG